MRQGICESLVMQSAQSIEFPFVAALPKREKSKLAKLWDTFKELHEVAKEKGMFVPPHVAASLLGVSRQRVHVLLNEGRIETVQVAGERYVLEDSLVAFCKLERASGRPINLPTTKREILRRSRSETRALKNSSK